VHSFRGTLSRLCEASSRWSIKEKERRIPFLSYFFSHLLFRLHILYILRRKISPFVFISSQLSSHKLPPLFPLRPVSFKSFSLAKSSAVLLTENYDLETQFCHERRCNWFPEDVSCLFLQFWCLLKLITGSFIPHFATRFSLVSCSAFSSTLKMEAIYYSETLLDFQRTVRSCISGDRSLHSHCCESFKPCIIATAFSNSWLRFLHHLISRKKWWILFLILF
jgi:hypothetical protein